MRLSNTLFGHIMLCNLWNSIFWSSMVDTTGGGVLSHNTKSPSLKCYMEFWIMAICNDIIHRSDITITLDFVAELGTNYYRVLTFYHIRWVSIENLQRVIKGRLLLWTPGTVPFGTYICSYVETTSLSETCHISRLWIWKVPQFFYYTLFVWFCMVPDASLKHYRKNVLKHQENNSFRCFEQVTLQYF